jgi:hypothetical protein
MRALVWWPVGGWDGVAAFNEEYAGCLRLRVAACGLPRSAAKPWE